MNSNVKYKNFKVFNRGASSVCEQFSSERCEGSLKARQTGRQEVSQSSISSPAVILSRLVMSGVESRMVR